jgi:thioredoxin reductase (NADPH)
MDTKRKLVIVGSGPAAWTAAIYAARAELKPLVLAGEQSGGQLMLTTKVENYPGFADGVMGQDLMAAMRQQAEKLGVGIIDQNATGIKIAPSLPSSFIIHHSSSIITAQAVILSTGASAITLKLPGEDRLMGRGVGTCAVCDAPFYRGKDTVFIIGGGDSAIEEATEIAKFASNVIVLVRKDSMRASPIMQKRIKSAQNIKIWYKSQAIEFIGDKKLERVKVNKDGTIAEYPADGLFYAIGHSPATKWLEGSGVKLDENGYIVTNSHQLSTINYSTLTSVPGIFAAGDCVDFRYRQAIVAAGQGCMAALDAQRWLENK